MLVDRRFLPSDQTQDVVNLEPYQKLAILDLAQIGMVLCDASPTQGPLTEGIGELDTELKFRSADHRTDDRAHRVFVSHVA